MSSRRAYLAPEVIQSSMMDCGPASLKSLLAGFGIDVGYGRLREACSTDVDGTSIDTLEDVGVELGLDAEQVMVPVDHLLFDEAETIPALLVVQRPHAPTHYVVLWRKHRGWLQIMDPAVGRRWVRAKDLLSEVYRHEMVVPAGAWREYVDSEVFRRPLLRRMAELHLTSDVAGRLVATAAADPTWRRFAALDAAVRLADRLVSGGGVRAGSEATRLVERLAGVEVDDPRIPDVFWCVRSAPAGDDGEERILHRGAVLVRVAGVLAPGERRETTAAEQLAPELLAALRAPTTTPWRPFFDALRSAGGPVLAVVGASLALASATVLVQALLFRSVLDLGYWLGIAEHRVGAAAALALFLLAALLLELPITGAMQRLGRRLDVLLRIAFMRKMPRTADHYFHSRPLSDLAERAQSMALLRSLPAVAGALLRGFFLLAFTAGALLWMAPWLSGWIVATVVIAAGLAFVSPAVLQEQEMRARSHGGILVRFYFDALMGISTLRAHGAGGALMREQEGIVVQWAEAQRRLARTGLVLEGVQAVVCAALAIGLVTAQVAREGTTGGILLVTYWALQLPILAQSLALSARQIPAIRNVLVRILEPLEAPEETGSDAREGEATPRAHGPIASQTVTTGDARGLVPAAASAVARASSGEVRREGVRIEMRDVTVRTGGHTVLEGVRLLIERGSQVAVVGESGAGKSTLVGLLLGWHRAGEGDVLVEGEPLAPTALARWRRHTAWVDPTVQLYNRRFAQNLLYGSEESVRDVSAAIDQAELREVLERLPDGLQTMMGEGGALVSGGEGQRVRIGRAWLRRDVRLVLLDEPFRGLDRPRRDALLTRARAHWAGATMICVTHDVTSTLAFPRVLVVDRGRVVEDGDPRALACDVASKYHRMLAAEQMVRENLWASPSWRRFRVDHGVVVEQGARTYDEEDRLVAAELEAAGLAEAGALPASPSGTTESGS